MPVLSTRIVLDIFICLYLVFGEILNLNLPFSWFPGYRGAGFVPRDQVFPFLVFFSILTNSQLQSARKLEARFRWFYLLFLSKLLLVPSDTVNTFWYTFELRYSKKALEIPDVKTVPLDLPNKHTKFSLIVCFVRCLNIPVVFYCQCQPQLPHSQKRETKKITATTFVRAINEFIWSFDFRLELFGKCSNLPLMTQLIIYYKI